MEKHAKLIVLLGVLGTSVSAVFTRVSTAPSMVLALYRMCIASLLLLPAVLTKHRADWKTLDRRTALLCALSGVFLAVHFTTYFESIHRTSVAAATILGNTQVFFVSLIMLALFHEKLSRRCWFAIGLTFCGGTVIALSSAGDGAALSGDLLALLCAALLACYTMIGHSCRRHNVSTSLYTFLVYSSAAVTLILLLPLTGASYFGYEPVNWLAAGGMVLFCTFLGHSVFSWGLKYEPPALVSTLQMLEPVFASVWAVLLFHEVPRLTVVLGGVVVITGIVLYCRCAEEA
ncbi:MAG: DMT family transporter [Oscillospiraceae bacterium]